MMLTKEELLDIRYEKEKEAKADGVHYKEFEIGYSN